MTRSDKWQKRPAVMKYFGFRNFIRLNANVMGYRLTEHLDITFIVPMPTSWSSKKRGENDGKPNQTRPDLDNYLKAFLDAMIDEDNFVWSVKATKVWGMEGKIIVHPNC